MLIFNDVILACPSNELSRNTDLFLALSSMPGNRINYSRVFLLSLLPLTIRDYEDKSPRSISPVDWLCTLVIKRHPVGSLTGHSQGQKDPVSAFWEVTARRGSLVQCWQLHQRGIDAQVGCVVVTLCITITKHLP
jgi:hypothetical protein